MIPSVVAALGGTIGSTSFSVLVWSALLVVVLVFVFIVRALIVDARWT